MSVERAERELEVAMGDLKLAQKRLEEADARVTKLRHYLDIAREFELMGDKEPVRRRQGGKGELLVSRCEDLIAAKGQNIPTRDLVSKLAAEGIHIGGKSPIANLSGALSRAPSLYNDRSTGWGLLEWLEAGAPISASGGSDQEGQPLGAGDADSEIETYPDYSP